MTLTPHSRPDFQSRIWLRPRHPAFNPRPGISTGPDPDPDTDTNTRPRWLIQHLILNLTRDPIPTRDPTPKLELNFRIKISLQHSTWNLTLILNSIQDPTSKLKLDPDSNSWPNYWIDTRPQHPIWDPTFKSIIDPNTRPQPMIGDLISRLSTRNPILIPDWELFPDT